MTRAALSLVAAVAFVILAWVYLDGGGFGYCVAAGVTLALLWDLTRPGLESVKAAKGRKP